MELKQALKESGLTNQSRVYLAPHIPDKLLHNALEAFPGSIGGQVVDFHAKLTPQGVNSGWNSTGSVRSEVGLSFSTWRFARRRNLHIKDIAYWASNWCDMVFERPRLITQWISMKSN